VRFTLASPLASALVSNLAKKVMPPLHIFFGFNPLRRRAVDHAQNASSLLRFGDDYLHRICGRANNIANFRNFFDTAKHIDWETVLHNDNEAVAGRDRCGIADRARFQIVIVSIGARQTRARRFIECNAEFHPRHGVDERLI
jgi:hypothetical protein